MGWNKRCTDKSSPYYTLSKSKLAKLLCIVIKVEPFFLRIFIYDMASGVRVTEEWRHIALAPNISEDGFNEVLDDVLGGGEIMPRKNSSSRSTAISPAIEGILRKSRKSSHNSNKVLFQTLKFVICVGLVA